MAPISFIMFWAAMLVFAVWLFRELVLSPPRRKRSEPQEIMRGFTYTRLDGQACTQVDLRGDTKDFFTNGENVLIRSTPVGGDWVRYWYVDADPERQAGQEMVVEAQEFMAGMRD